jgi:vacuolar-type H+-ATPase subunit I/STV1
MSWFSSKENDTKTRLDSIDEKTRMLHASFEEKTKELDDKTNALEEKTKELDDKTKALEEKTKALYNKTLALDEQSKALDDKTNLLDEKINAFETYRIDTINSIRIEVKEALKNFQNQDSVKTVLYYDGSLYQGRLENNLPHGFGVIVHGNGVRYAGNWKNGLYDGSGVLYYPGMPPWNAMWKSHLPHGKCTYDFINFTEYVDGVLQ